jgi:hypothetical protein
VQKDASTLFRTGSRLECYLLAVRLQNGRHALGLTYRFDFMLSYGGGIEAVETAPSALQHPQRERVLFPCRNEQPLRLPIQRHRLRALHGGDHFQSRVFVSGVLMKRFMVPFLRLQTETLEFASSRSSHFFRPGSMTAATAGIRERLPSLRNELPIVSAGSQG